MSSSILCKLRAWSFGLVCLLLFSCTSYHPLVKYDSSVYEINSSYSASEDSAMKGHIAPFKTAMEKEMNVTLAVSAQAMTKERPEGLLGNFAADVVLKKSREYCKDSCKVDFCVLNNGGLRNPLPKGNITQGDVFEFMPFENAIVVLTLNGNEVKELLDFIANKGGMPVAGMRMKIKNAMASDAMIGDKLFDVTQSYTVVTSDYLSNGGDNMTFFSKASKTISMGKKIRDIVIEYLLEQNKMGNNIIVKKDGRIQSDK